MVADGGDVIFQDASMDMFARSPDRIRVVLHGRPPINAGMLIGPSTPIQRCLVDAFFMIQDRSNWVPDMVALKYILHREGFVPIEESCNCMITAARSDFRIRRGPAHLPAFVRRGVQNLALVAGRPGKRRLTAKPATTEVVRSCRREPAR
jgi:hypothetical protein